MRRTARRTLALAVPLLAAAGLVLTPLVATAGSAPTKTTVRPGELPRGDGPQVPWIHDGRLLHDEVAVRVPRYASLLGRSGTDYLILVHGNEDSRVVRVAPDGSRERVLTMPATHLATLSDDGTTLLRTVQRRVEGDWFTTIRLHDPVTGDRYADRTFSGIRDVLDADEGRAVLGGWSPNRTLLWDLGRDRVRRLVRQPGYFADLSADRFATVTKDPYSGGCSVLRRISAPGEVLTRSCEERVASVSPSGRRVATIHILSDGLGPRDLTVRRATGRKLAEYRIAGWFGRIDFETGRSLLFDAAGRHRQALVRCDGAACERASRLSDAPEY